MKQDFLKKAIVILGMHRSGTSALTRVLNLCGVSLPKTLMPPQAGNNETGFWESSKVMLVNDELLAYLKSSWDDLSVLPEGWQKPEEIKPYREKLTMTLENEFSASQLFVLKDPRICKLLPVWLEVLAALEIAPYFVLPIRHPLEVAASLERRDGLFKAHSLLLWLQHFLLAERATRQFKRVFVSYDSLLKDWSDVVRTISAELNLDLMHFETLNRDEIDHFLNPGLRHHKLADDLSNYPAISGWVTQTFSWARAAADGVSPKPEVLDSIYDAYVNGDKAFGQLVKEVSQENAELLLKLHDCRLVFQSQLEAGQAQPFLFVGGAALTGDTSGINDTEHVPEVNASEVEALRSQLTATEAELSSLREDLKTSRVLLHEAQQNWWKAQSQLREAQAKWAHALQIIDWMESSLFWKLRASWIRLKQFSLGFNRHSQQDFSKDA
ncbi:MAG: hypothetical protein AAGF01_06975 [Cyanobacteria bacterium P01_G01_bin.38]